MPKLIRLYIHSVAVGFALAAAFSGVLVWQDVAGIGRLILGSDIGWVALAMLVVFHGIVFAAVQFAIAVMALGNEDGPAGGLHDHAQMIPIRVEATTRDARATRR